MSDSIGSVSVDVVPDAGGFKEKLAAATRGVTVKVGVDLDDNGFKAKLDALAKNQKVKVGVDLDDRGAKTRLRDILRKRTVVVNVDAKTATAKARLDAITARERRLQVKADLDTKLAEAKLAKLTRPRNVNVKANVEGTGFQGLTSDLFSLKGAVASLGPTLIPVTAAVGGLAGALAAPALAGGLTGGIFGGVALAAVKKAATDLKAIQKLENASAAATDPKVAADLQKEADITRHGLPKSEQALFQSVGRIQDAFDAFIVKTGPRVYGLFTKALDIGTKALPKLVPLIDAVGGAAIKMVDKFGKFTNGNGFTTFLDFLQHQGLHALEQFVGITKNVAVGVAGMVEAFFPLGTGVYDTLGRVTKRFASFGQGLSGSKGFNGFLSYVRQVGPKVSQTIGDVSAAIGHLILALAPQGSTVLGVIDGLAKTIVKLKPGEIAAIAGAVGALGLATGKFGKLTSNFRRRPRSVSDRDLLPSWGLILPGG